MTREAGATRQPLQPQSSPSWNSWSRVECGLQSTSEVPTGLHNLLLCGDSVMERQRCRPSVTGRSADGGKALSQLGMVMFQMLEVELVGIDGGRQKTVSRNPKSLFTHILNLSLLFAMVHYFNGVGAGSQ